jgi:SpoVK/Ycf46/Vps4 family AAA+-type ATPase
MEPYADSLEHLCDELKRVDLLVRRALLISRAASSKKENAFRGLVISEPDIDGMLDSGEFLSHYWRQQDLVYTSLQPLEARLQLLSRDINARLAVSAASGRRLTLPFLAQSYALSPAEVDLLLIALAPELEPRYETLYAYLQDDVTRNRPSVDLALNLICRNEREKVRARHFFGPEALLMRFQMLELLEDPHDRQPTLLRKFLKLEEPLLRWLLENPSIVLPLGMLSAPRTTIADLEASQETRQQLTHLTQCLNADGTTSTIVRFTGVNQDELRSAAEGVARAIGKSLIFLTSDEAENPKNNLSALARNCTLLNAAIAVISSEAAPPSDPDGKPTPAKSERIWSIVHHIPGPTFALGPADAFGTLPADFTRIWRVEFPPPDYALRHKSWQSALAAVHSDVDPGRLADTFRFGGAEIRKAIGLASSLAAVRDPAQPVPTNADLLDAGRSLTSTNLTRYAVPIQPRYTWDDIILPGEKMQRLKHIAARFEHRRTVNREWGFGEKLSRGKGLNILFTGLSGVGKTMAAEVLASALSLVLYQIDLSAVVSKFVGETEKSLSAIFREAELSQSLLFFDEADSFFAKRGEVQQAHDRYANFEVNYLLQRIEHFEGIVVLATNLQRNIDDAFLRRMHEVIDFSMPDESLRERIWRHHIPRSAPVAADIDFAFLARQFRFSGANIKNSVLSAAYLAAGRSRPIGMAEMIQGVRMELEKQGKLVMKTDFGRHFAATQSALPEKGN